MVRRRLLLKLYDLLYTRLAWSYDMAGWAASGGLWNQWVAQALPFVEEGPVLEVGFGRGHLLRALADAGQQVIGVDWSFQMARHALRQGREGVLRGDGRALPFNDGHFATLVTTFPAPYILERESQCEFARVVRPGGLWVWVDAPTLRLTPATALAWLLAWVAWGSPRDSEHALERLSRDRSGGLWQVHHERVQVGPSTVLVRLARRLPA